MSHSVICGQDELGQQPNQWGEVSDVKHPANMMVTDNAVMLDSPRSKDLYMNPAHRPLTSSRCVHQFVRSQSEFVRSRLLSK